MRTTATIVLAALALAGGWLTLTAAENSDADAEIRSFQAKFRATCGKMAGETREKGAMTAIGRDDWLFLANELRHLSVGEFWGEKATKVSRATREKFADPLPAIVDYHQQLEAAGIELILVPVPPKAAVYPDKLTTNVPTEDVGSHELPVRVDPFHQQFYEHLAEKGVEVLDLTDAMRLARLGKDALPEEQQSSFPQLSPKATRSCCRTDTHWSGQTCVLAAKMIHEQLKDRDWFKQADKPLEGKLKTRAQNVAITGDLTESANKHLGDDEKIGREELSLRFVGTPAEDDTLTPVETSDESPVILLGDSHTLVFHMGGEMHTRGAGLADQLAFELGMPIDVIGVMGSGARPARINLYKKGRADENYLPRKKVVIWCLSARELTESNWGKIPVTKR